MIHATTIAVTVRKTHPDKTRGNKNTHADWNKNTHMQRSDLRER